MVASRVSSKKSPASSPLKRGRPPKGVATLKGKTPPTSPGMKSHTPTRRGRGRPTPADSDDSIENPLPSPNANRNGTPRRGAAAAAAKAMKAMIDNPNFINKDEGFDSGDENYSGDENDIDPDHGASPKKKRKPPVKSPRAKTEPKARCASIYPRVSIVFRRYARSARVC